MIEVIAFDLDDTLWAVRPIIINAEKRLNGWLFQHVPHIKYDVVGMRALRHDLLDEEPDLILQFCISSPGNWCPHGDVVLAAVARQ